MQMQRTAVAWLLWIFQAAALAQPIPPARIAPEARFDVYGSPEVVALQQPELIKGLGATSRIGWMKKGDQGRAFTTSFPLTHFSSTEISLRFTPSGQGITTISLLGSYNRIPGEKDGLYQEEIVWEAIDLQGAVFTPETQGLLRLPVRSWFRQRYELGVQVKKDVPVTIRFVARPQIPAGLEPLKPVPNADTPAHRMAKLLSKGIALLGNSENGKQGLGNALSRTEDLELIRREGFDHVRITLPWHSLAGKGPDARISPDVLARVDLLVAEAAKHNLAIVLSWHDFDAFYANPAAESARFLAIWKQLGTHYADFPATLAYELLNPADNQADTSALNPIYAEVIKDIRQVSLVRTILCSPGRMGNPAELARLLPPDNEQNLIVSLHSREPEPFVQQAFGAPSLNRLAGIQFPGPPALPLGNEATAGLDLNLREWVARYQSLPSERNPSGPKMLQQQAQWASRWADHYHRPVYFAEIGCDSRIESGSRARYYSTWRNVMQDSGLAWAVSDWTQMHRYWDAKSHRPLPGMREALFPERAGASTSVESKDGIQHALRELDALRTQLETTERTSSEELGKLKARATDAQQQAQQTHELARWLMVGLLALALVVIVSLVVRRRPPVELLPTLTRVQLEALHDPGDPAAQSPLTEVLKQKVVQRLLSDRQQSRLLQNCAAQELAVLEQRLAELQAPIEVRLNAYEQKIQELEEELRQKGLENRELLETKIELAKQRLAVARTGSPNEWN